MAFIPTKYVVSKDRRRGVIVSGNSIDWENLTEEEVASQWAACTNAVWFAEKEGVITRKDLEPIFYDYLKSIKCPPDHIKAIRKAKEWQLSTNLLTIAFVLYSGAKNNKSAQYLINKVKELVVAGRQIKDVEEEKQPNKPARNIQEAMKNKLSDILGEMQGLEDDMTPGIIKWLQSHDIPKVYIDDIEKYYKPRLDELKSIATTKDDQLREGYASYRKKDITKMISWYEELMVDLDAYKRMKQGQRKIRVRKPKSPTKLVSKLRYMSYSDDYKLQSIKAESIIGSTVLWAFNTKTRRLCVYNASEMDKELSVRGTTILGWDPKTSYGKTLRKPVDQLKEFMEGGKVAMRNLHKTIKGKEAKLNGRINKDMILLKVY